MKRKVFIILLSVSLVITMALCIVGCDKNGGSSSNNGGDIGVTVSGTYYEVNNDVIDEDTYIQFKNSTWTDDGGINGTFTLGGNVLTLFLTIDGEKEEYMSGRVNGDDIKFDDDTIYRKGEDITEKPKRLDFALSEDKSYYIVKGIGGLSGEIVVPETYKQKPVKEIAEKAFANSTYLTSIELPESVDTLGERAFYKCRNLLSAEITGEMQVIPTELFSGCDSLTSVTLPAVKEIQMDAFKDCYDLEDVTFLGTASQWCMIDFKDGYEGGIGGGVETTYYSNPLIVSSDAELIIDGEVVTDITVDASEIKANVFSGYNQLKTVTLTSSVTKIGDNAFSHCSNLTSVDMKDSKVTSIGKEAFYVDYQLSSVTFPQSLEYIDNSAFEDCKKLQAVELGNSLEEIGENAFGYCESLKTLSLGNSVMTIGRGAFASCGYTQITIPAAVIFIGGYAFSSSSLTHATFERKSGWKVDNTSTGYVTTEKLEESWLNDPAAMANYLTDKGYPQIAVCDWYVDTLVYTLSSDGTYYFVSNNGTITQSTIVIPEKYNNKPVKAIVSSAFWGCSSLRSIVIPSSVTSIDEDAFYGCSRLKSIVVDAKNTKYSSQDGILYNKEKTEFIHIPEGISGAVVIPNSITSIGDDAFWGCSSLTSITFGENSQLTSIGSSAFRGCSSLTSITFGENSQLTSIGSSAFWGCSSLTSITFGENSQLTSIGSSAFSGCSSLTSITFGENSQLTSIGSDAFSGCSSLTSIEIPSGVTSIGSYAFDDCSSLQYNEYDNGLYLGNKENPYIVLVKAKDTNIASCEISTNTKFIYSYAFSNCSSLTSIKIPNSLTSIGSGAFSNCSSLTSIKIPNSLTSIGDRAFFGCISLTGVYITDIASWCAISFGRSEANPLDYAHNLYLNNELVTELVIPSSVTSIGSSAFWGCSSLTSITFGENSQLTSIGSSAFRGCSSLTSIEIPSSVTSIGDRAFYGCSSITSVTFGENSQLTSIGSSAFEDCSSLTSIEIPSSVTSIGSNAFTGCSSLTIYCEAKSKPSGWSSSWNYSNRPVVWGHKISG